MEKKKPTGLLTRDALLKKEDLKTEKVMFEDGTFVFVREMTGRERDRFENAVLSKEVKEEDGTVKFERSMEDFRAKLAVNTMCDDKGNLLLQPEDVETLSTHMSGARLVLIANKAQSLSLITAQDKKELTKNSGAVQADSSTSDSVES